jgi:hypothetical protein
VLTLVAEFGKSAPALPPHRSKESAAVAEVTMTAVYECSLEDEVDAPLVWKAIDAMNEAAVEVSRHSSVDVETGFLGQGFTEGKRLRWTVMEKFDAEVLRAWDADSVARRIENAAGRFEDVAGTIVGRSSSPALAVITAMRQELRSGTPLHATATVPLRAGDQEVIGDSPLTFVKTALRSPHPFSADLHRQLDGMTVELQGRYLVISGGSVPAVGFAAAAFVRARRPISVTKPRQPYWAYGTAAILAARFALSWLPLSTGSVVALSATTVGALASALLVARHGNLVGRTAVGLVPALLLIVFAVIYSIAGLSGATLGLGDGEALHLRDPLLLSLSLGSTVGVLDLTVTGWLRSIAYLEMLLVAGYLGTTAVIAVRSLSGRLDQTIRELRLERESG